MNLHKFKDEFNDLIIETANYFNIDSKIVKQDYFVSLLLKNIVIKVPEIVFKGGTSLSKCYDLINRYSEDIDLAVEDINIFSQASLKNFNKKVLQAIKETDFIINNEEDFKSGMNMNTYMVNIEEDNMFENEIKVETFLALSAYPIEKSYAKCYIYKYLLEEGHNHLIDQFELNPIEITTQILERTFIDKVFAICDYYESKIFARNSRHLYDLYKLLPYIQFNKNFFELMNLVKQSRNKANSRINISSAPDYKIEKALKEIIMGNSFEKDYNEVTSKLIFDKTNYEECIKSLNKIQKQIAGYQAIEM